MPKMNTTVTKRKWKEIILYNLVFIKHWI
jgi:hypothetical protein